MMKFECPKCGGYNATGPLGKNASEKFLDYLRIRIHAAVHYLECGFTVECKNQVDNAVDTMLAAGITPAELKEEKTE